jgi:outer membrane protein, heavy metal efflux system
MRRRTCLGSLGLLVACGAVDPRPEQDEARREILRTTGASEVYAPGSEPAALEAVLADGLTLDEATRLALVENRRLQAGFARLGVSKAELVQAGLLRNPTLSLGFLFPSGGGSPQWTLDLAQSVVELWQLPRREAVARAELARDVLTLSRFAGELVAAVRTSYFEAVAARERTAVAREGAALARSALEAVLGRVAGGVASEADSALARTEAARAEHAALQAELAAAGSKRALAALLSLSEDLAPVTLTDPLPEPSGPVRERESLVALARTSRLDLRASERSVEAARARLGLEQSRRWPEVELSLSAERPELGNEPDLMVGPGASVELPVFDSNLARASAAEFELDARTKEHEALLAEVAQDVRAAADRAAAAAQAALQVERELLPHAERSHELAQGAQALGSATVLAVLESQRAVLAARESMVEGRLEAALARIQLELVLGLPLGDVP